MQDNSVFYTLERWGIGDTLAGPVIRTWLSSYDGESRQVFSGLSERSYRRSVASQDPEHPDSRNLLTLEKLLGDPRLVQWLHDCKDDTGYAHQRICLVYSVYPTTLQGHEHFVISTFAKTSRRSGCGPCCSVLLYELAAREDCALPSDGDRVEVLLDTYPELFCPADRIELRIAELRMKFLPQSRENGLLTGRECRQQNYWRAMGRQISRAARRGVEIAKTTDDIADDLAELRDNSPARTLTLRGCSLRREHLAIISANPTLQDLNLIEPRISLDVLQSLASLEMPAIRLSLRSASDAEMEAISSVPSVKSVTLTAGSISEEGVRKLSRLPQLEELRILHCNGVISGIEYLVNANQLKDLEIVGCRWEDTAYDAVQRLGALAALDLSLCSSIDDRLCYALQCLENLAELRIDGTNVTDAGLAALANCRNLKFISIRDTELISRAAIDRFMAEKPEIALRV